MNLGVFYEQGSWVYLSNGWAVNRENGFITRWAAPLGVYYA